MNNNSYYVNERIFRLDCGRKYFTPKWIKRLIDEIAAIGYNAITLHFAEDMAFRLESKRYPWLAGGDNTLCPYGESFGCPEDNGKFITQAEMADIVRYAIFRGVDVIPSLDSPGHMTYIVKKYKLNCGKVITSRHRMHASRVQASACGLILLRQRRRTSFSKICARISPPLRRRRSGNEQEC